MLHQTNENEEQPVQDKNYLYFLNEYHYIDILKYFSSLFGQIPTDKILTKLDYDNACRFIETQMKDDIVTVNGTDNYNYDQKKYDIVHRIYVLKNDRMIAFKLSHQREVHILFKTGDEAFADAVAVKLRRYKRKFRKEKKFELNLISRNEFGLCLTQLQVNKNRLDISMNYNDDFQDIHKLIVNRLNKKNDKGLILLHGKPGTGKTTYIRHLIGLSSKKMIFVPSHVASQITDPDFISLMIENPNSVLVIEDAENIIMNRNNNNSSVVSVLLNIADGLLADCLNIQIICTFNTSLQNIDEALLRKGRLIAKYEFKELTAEKAQRLSEELGFHSEINEAVTLAEIYNQNEKDFTPEKKVRIGFK